MDNEFQLFDSHVHTSEVSFCGKVPAMEMVRRYKKAGYEGIIITDHYYGGYFDSLSGLPWEQKVESFLSGYKIALKEGSRIGLKVLLGMEITFFNSPEDYLVYGLDEEYLIGNPKLYDHTLDSFKSYIEGTGALIFQAHPFRRGLTPAPYDLLDGVEIYNGNPRHNSNNDSAYAYAKDNNLKMIAGSDGHQIEDVGKAGILIPKEIDSMDKFIEWYVNKAAETEHIYINDDK